MRPLWSLVSAFFKPSTGFPDDRAAMVLSWAEAVLSLVDLGLLEGGASLDALQDVSVGGRHVRRVGRC